MTSHHSILHTGTEEQQTCAQLDDQALNSFIQQQKNINTKRKTQTDVQKWHNWCTSVGETRSIGELTETQLDRLLGHFFAGIRKKDGTLYEPDTLSSFQRSLDRHLTQELHKPYSILRDAQFSSSRQALKAARKFLVSQGKGKAQEGVMSTTSFV